MRDDKEPSSRSLFNRVTRQPNFNGPASNNDILSTFFDVRMSHQHTKSNSHHTQTCSDRASELTLPDEVRPIVSKHFCAMTTTNIVIEHLSGLPNPSNTIVKMFDWVLFSCHSQCGTVACQSLFASVRQQWEFIFCLPHNANNEQFPLWPANHNPQPTTLNPQPMTHDHNL